MRKQSALFFTEMTGASWIYIVQIWCAFFKYDKLGEQFIR